MGQKGGLTGTNGFPLNEFDQEIAGRGSTADAACLANVAENDLTASPHPSPGLETGEGFIEDAAVAQCAYLKGIGIWPQGLYSRLMSSHSILLLAAALYAQPAAWGGTEPPPTSLSTPAVAPTNTTVEAEYQRVEAEDDKAQAEVDKWKRENTAAKGRGAGLNDEEFERRVKERLAPIQKAYQDFLRAHPDHPRARLAYGCFLNDHQDELGAQVQWEKALELDPSNPDVYNNLAGRYSESGPVKKAFEYYEKAIQLNPNQALYYNNFAGAMYVLRKKAMTHYGLDEQQVFAKIIQLYSNSVRLDPKNFTYASDLAQTYYSLRPFPAEGALSAWSNALLSAQSEPQREETYVHLARATMLSGRFADARQLLTSVTNNEQLILKSNLLHNIEQRELESGTKPAGAKKLP